MKKVSVILAFALAFGILPYIAQALDKTGLALYLNFDEGKGDKANDLSGKGNNGKLLGGVKWVDGKYKGGIYLAEIPDRVDVADSDSLDITEKLTLAIWANVESIPNSACSLFQKPTAYMLHTVPVGDKIQVDPLVFIGGSYGAWPTPVKANAKMGEWHHFAATYDGKKYDIFIDGKRVDGYDRQPPGNIDVDQNALTIGRDTRVGCEQRNSPCTIDEVMVWSRALSEAEIKEVMQGGLTPVELNGKLSTCWGNIRNQ